MTTKFTKADVQAAAPKLAKSKVDAEPERFRKIPDPGARLAAARSEVWRENPELVGLDHEAERS
jgi:hypothetical protein